jgi:hypothetical protein
VAVEEQFEDGEVLDALDERRLQRRSHERTLADADVDERVDAVDGLGARSVDTGATEVARESDDGVEQSCRELRGRRTIVRRTNVVPSRRFTWGV